MTVLTTRRMAAKSGETGDHVAKPSTVLTSSCPFGSVRTTLVSVGGSHCHRFFVEGAEITRLEMGRAGQHEHPASERSKLMIDRWRRHASARGPSWP